MHALKHEAGAEGQAWRVDLSVGRFGFYRGGEPILVAEAKLLCTWGVQSRALVMGWANADVVGGAVIAALDGFDARYVDVEAHDAETIAMVAADRVGADAFHRVTEGAVWAWIGLWNPRIPDDTDRARVSGPEPFVARLIASLIGDAEPDDVHADDLAARCANAAAICDRVAGDRETTPLSAARLRELAVALRAAAPGGSDALDFRERAAFTSTVQAAGARFRGPL